MISKVVKILFPIFLLLINVIELITNGNSILIIVAIILCVVWLILEILTKGE